MGTKQRSSDVEPDQRARRSWLAGPSFHYALLGLICLLPLILYAPILTTPFNGDEGFYATVAKIMLDGGIPYRDAFDNKPPLIFGWYAFSFILFGESVWAPRLVVALLLSLTTALVYVEARLVFSRGSGLMAATMFGFSIGITKFETNAQTEYFMLLPMAAGLVAYTAATRFEDKRWYFLAGVLNGLAIITRQTAVFPFATILAYAVLIRPTVADGRRAAVRPVIVMLGGASVVGIAMLLPFLITGTAGDFWDALVVYGWTYSSDVPIYVKVINLPLQIPPLIFVAGPFFILAGLGVAYALRDDRRPPLMLLVLWLAAAVLGVVSVGRYYHHQFDELLPALALLAPAGARFIGKRWQRFPVRLSSYLVFSFTVAVTAVLNGALYVKGDANARHEVVYPDNERTEWQTRSEALGDYIRDRSAESDAIYNLGFQPELYFYADRRPASRYAFDHLFLTDESLEPKAVAELTRNPPLYIIDSSANETQRHAYEAPLIRQFLRANYDYVGMVEYANIYKRKAG